MATRALVVQRGLRLEYLTLGWNSLEGLIAIVAGWLAGSIALIGFGLDSAIEVSSGAVMLWRLRINPDRERREQAERRALKLVGISFLALAAYVAVDASKSLITREPPDESWVGIGLAVLSLIVMPLLARAKRRVAAQLGSGAMRADFEADGDLCLSFRHSSGRIASERSRGMVVGGPAGGARDGSVHRTRGNRSRARPDVL